MPVYGSRFLEDNSFWSGQSLAGMTPEALGFDPLDQAHVVLAKTLCRGPVTQA